VLQSVTFARREAGGLSAWDEELHVVGDVSVSDFDEVDELGRDQRASDLGVNVDLPVCRSPLSLDGE
jgi:hypothetical protein